MRHEHWTRTRGNQDCRVRGDLRTRPLLLRGPAVGLAVGFAAGARRLAPTFVSDNASWGAVKIRTPTYDSGAAQLIKSSTCCDVIVPGSTARSTVCADPYAVGLSRSQANKLARILTA